jgi:hypothetical protein
MKLSALAISAAALAAVYGGSALGQATAPVTMQPIPNPPEKAKPAHMAKHRKHHASAKATADKADAADKTDTAATPAK